MDATAPVHCDLNGTTRRCAETEKPEPASGLDATHPQRAVPDDAAAEQRGSCEVVDRIGQPNRDVGPDGGELRIAAIAIPAGEGGEFRQRFSRPSRQRLQRPHAAASQVTPARSPSAQPATSPPTASTRPTIWWPGTIGSRRATRSPSASWRSVRQTPQAATRSSNSPEPASGRRTSRSSSGDPDAGAGCSSTSARMCCAPRERYR